ncbi:hypothetical protein ACLOJK_006018 [Asimina triloba]
MASTSAGPAGSAVLKSYAQVVNNKSEHPTFKILMHFPVDIDGEMSFVFSELEMIKAADEFRYALVMKFMKTRHSIDKIRLTVVKTWGLIDVPTISFMDEFHVLIYMKNERDFVHGWTCEGRTVEGLPFRDSDNSDEECEEVWHGDEPELQGSAQEDRVQTTGLNEEENNDRLGNGSPQGEVMTGYSSEREEGKITVFLGKEKLYDTDGERRSTAAKVTKSDAYKENLVRKSLRVTSTELERTLRELVVILDLCLP